MKMARIAEVAGRRTLEWTQPVFMRREYALYAEDELVATLRFRDRPAGLATGKAADGSWTFNSKTGFLTKPTVTVSLTKSKEIIAVVHFHFRWLDDSATIEFANGSRFRATRGRKVSFTKDQNQPLVTIDNVGAMWQSAPVEVVQSAASLPEVPVLILLGWYLIIEMSWGSEWE